MFPNCHRVFRVDGDRLLAAFLRASVCGEGGKCSLGDRSHAREGGKSVLVIGLVPAYAEREGNAEWVIGQL